MQIYFTGHPLGLLGEKILLVSFEIHLGLTQIVKLVQKKKPTNKMIQETQKKKKKKNIAFRLLAHCP